MPGRTGAASAARHAGAVDVVLLGTFSAWKLGTLQARALPQAAALQAAGLRCVLLTVPWDQLSERGVHDSVGGVPVIATRAANPTMPLPALAEIDARLRAWRPAAVQIMKPRGFGGLAAERLLAQRRRPFLLVDADDWEGDGGWNRVGTYGPLQRRVLHWQEQALLRRADAVTTASRILQYRAAALRDTPAEAITYLPNGLTPAWAALLAPALAASDARTERRVRGTLNVLLYSRFEEIGPEWIDAVADACAARGVRAQFTVVGEAADSRNGCRSDCVRLMGYVSRESIPTYLQATDIALLPLQDSLVGRAKNSVKLLEVMAAGCVTIASAVGDVPETLGGAGVSVSGSDPALFAQAIAEMAGRPEQMAALSKQAMTRAQTHFRYPDVAAPLVAAYAARGIVRG